MTRAPQDEKHTTAPQDDNRNICPVIFNETLIIVYFFWNYKMPGEAKSTSGKEKYGLLYFFPDADGAVFHDGATAIERIICANEALFVHMLQLMAENPTAEIRMGISSSRQSRLYDEDISSGYHLPPYRDVIVAIAKELERRWNVKAEREGKLKRTVTVDHYLLCYSFHNIPEGTPLDQIERKQDCFKDEPKILVHYGFSHRTASYAESKGLGKTAMVFYDNEESILDAPGKFFGALPGYLSSAVDICPYPYRYGRVESPKPVVRGTGPTDHEYHRGVKELCTHAEVPQSVWHRSESKDHTGKGLHGNNYRWDLSKRLLNKKRVLPRNLVEARPGYSPASSALPRSALPSSSLSSSAIAVTPSPVVAETKYPTPPSTAPKVFTQEQLDKLIDAYTAYKNKWCSFFAYFRWRNCSYDSFNTAAKMRKEKNAEIRYKLAEEYLNDSKNKTKAFANELRKFIPETPKNVMG